MSFSGWFAYHEYFLKQMGSAHRQFHVLSLLRSLHVLADCDFKLCKNRSAPPRGA